MPLDKQEVLEETGGGVSLKSAIVFHKKLIPFRLVSRFLNWAALSSV